MQSLLIRGSHLSRLGRYSFNLSRPSILNRDHSASPPINHQHQLNQVRNFSIVEAALGVRSAIANSAAVDQIQKTLISVHDATGMPWWLEICLTAVALRLICLPLIVAEKKESIKFDKIIVPEMKKKLEKLHETSRRKLQMRELRSDALARKWFDLEKRNAQQQLYQQHNAHPGKRVILVLANFPIWVLSSFSIGILCSQNLRFISKHSIAENMMHATPQASLEGCLWFPNLIMPDPYCVLPLLLMFAMVNNIRYNRLVRRYQFDEDQRRRPLFKVINFFIKASAIVVPAISVFVPSGLTLYWTANSMCYLGSSMLWNNAKIKRVFGVEDNKYNVGFNDLLEDYMQMIDNVYKKLKR